SRMEWFLFCCRTGQGDVSAAAPRARQHAERRKEVGADDGKMLSGVMHYLNDEEDEALADFRADWDGRREMFCGYHALLIADELDKTADRDVILQQITANMPENRDFQDRRWRARLAPLFLSVLRKGDASVWNSRKLDDLLLEIEPGEVTNVYYFAGRFLANRGEKKLSRIYLEKAATSPIRWKFTCTMANYVLRKDDAAVGPTRGGELDEATQRLAEAVRHANSLRFGQLPAKAVDAYEKALEIDPKCRPAIWGRAMAEEKLEQFDRALADYGTLLELSPDDTIIRQRHVSMLEKTHAYAQAVAGYKAGLAANPDWTEGHRDLAWLLATCPEAKLRNGALALEHAAKAAKVDDADRWKTSVVFAAAYAELGKFDEAVAAAKRASQQVGGEPQTEIARQMALYEQQKKYEPPPETKPPPAK
ncbi:MAG TPA: hypothetical protein VKU82_15725, partial [Planctomycetaceae bacterium]|nr:hypothetical protein [Planctomycetaceae bacterium]